MSPGGERFVLKCDKGLHALKYFLAERDYNFVVHSQVDSRGNPLISLSYKYNPERENSAFEWRGLILVADRSYLDRAVALVQEYITVFDGDDTPAASSNDQWAI